MFKNLIRKVKVWGISLKYSFVKNWKGIKRDKVSEEPEISPIVEELAGIVKDGPLDYKTSYTKYLKRKYA